MSVCILWLQAPGMSFGEFNQESNSLQERGVSVEPKKSLKITKLRKGKESGGFKTLDGKKWKILSPGNLLRGNQLQLVYIQVPFSPASRSESFFGMSWTLCPLCDQDKRTSWLTAPLRPHAEGGVAPLGIRVILHTEKNGCWVSQNNRRKYIAGFLCLLFIIQAFSCLYNQ